MEQPRVLISALVIERLKRFKYSAFGQLLGVTEDDCISVLGFCVKNSSKPNAVSEGITNVTNEAYNHDIIPHLPANCCIIGAFIVSLNDNVNKLEDKLFEHGLKVSPLLLIADVDESKIVTKLKKADTHEKINYEIPDGSYWKKFIHFRVIGRLYASCNFDYKAGEKAFAYLKDRINQSLALKLKGSDIYLFENNADGPGITDESTVEDLRSLVNPAIHNHDNGVLTCELLMKNDFSKVDAAPVIMQEGGNFNWTSINLLIDALSFVDIKTNIKQLRDIILESVQRNIILSEWWLIKDMKNSTPENISVPEMLHFYPPEIGHFITIACPSKKQELEKKKFRGVIHNLLDLPTHKPYFRAANEYCFDGASSRCSKILSNPHEGLSGSGVANGSVSLVQGRYDYHHYMQDGVNDNGWGCAYRSLQTIISWYRYQGYYSKPVPTHTEIQKALVSYGDKPRAFVGSKDWIGSVEVSFVLETLLDVPSRILRVETGEEMSMKGGELSYHFKSQGSPVMIGGGVLAHTILGVDYNKKTGDIKFLVLDPHYVGEEDLSVVQGKGWCAWKGIDFWKKDQFYNMCLPQLPNDPTY